MILKPEALEELLAKEPEEYEEADILLMIEHFRAQRAAFVLQEAMGKPARTKATKAADPTVAALLEDLI